MPTPTGRNPVGESRSYLLCHAAWGVGLAVTSCAPYNLTRNTTFVHVVRPIRRHMIFASFTVPSPLLSPSLLPKVYDGRLRVRVDWGVQSTLCLRQRGIIDFRAPLISALRRLRLLSAGAPHPCRPVGLRTSFHSIPPPPPPE